MKQSVKYGGLSVATGLTGWLIAMTTHEPSPYLLVGAAVLAAALFLWSGYWAIRDFRAWLSGSSDTDPGSPPFVFTWRVEKDDAMPLRRLIPLSRAAIAAYPKIRKRVDVQVLEALDGKREKIPGMVAQMLLNHPGFDLPLFGVFPPAEDFGKIPDDDVKSFRISDDAKELFDTMDSHRRYKGLAIKKSDLERRLKELGA